ncbi:MAG: GTPase Era [Bacilli bacterium]|jgi:GTP-binding protein Era|nr:GTPase Era [Bacilli bacterium]
MKVGFVTIIGRSNVGKSTILNALLNKSLAIVTNKPQTTRENLRGLYEDEYSQIVFIDTPGVHKPHHELGKVMNKNAFASLSEVEVIVLGVDASKRFGEGDRFLLSKLDPKTPLIIVLNKIDLVTITQVTKLKEEYQKHLSFPYTLLEMSAIRLFNVNELLEEIKKHLVEGLPFYPLGSETDRDEFFFAKEIVRQQALLQLREEVPHQLAVIIEKYTKKAKAVVIEALIIVEKPSHKAIVIGKEGKRLKQIGTNARLLLEKRLKERVHLTLHVIVKKDWFNNPRLLKEYGYY